LKDVDALIKNFLDLNNSATDTALESISETRGSLAELVAYSGSASFQEFK